MNKQCEAVEMQVQLYGGTKYVQCLREAQYYDVINHKDLCKYHYNKALKQTSRPQNSLESA